MSSHRPNPALPALAALLALALASPALADPHLSIRPASEIPVELLRPAAGEVLEAGREATVAWRTTRDLAAEGIEEWEAFLSFDGGRRWPVRITPHLDIELSSFRFVVPPVASGRARLMLRFGDEESEVGYVLPLELRTVVPATAWAPAPAPSWRRGERARADAPGVVLWVEGRRDGRDFETRAAIWSPPGLRALRTPGVGLRPLLAPVSLQIR